MALDPERASLVSQPYRYAILDDEDTLALYRNSKAIEIATNLDKAGGEALAREIFDASGVSTRTFSLTIEGALSLDDFVGGPPRYRLKFDRNPAANPAKTYTVIAARFRPLSNTTTLTVRG
ncbi:MULTISPECIES: hypothetical protein [Sphingomonas]|uniref:hypothetical protein n=1 Tax=Sphingomonas TaxID=13687 RepID=UPI000F7F4855|nr:hypothetical protein [Sphingomonas sp. ABOLF]RSV14645.1 hypothetical protein CA235_11235 [Sphingomonas sp. ABOLF]GLK19247.1 hypothetical protein GCM10017606_00730 [Microbacterium terregens]